MEKLDLHMHTTVSDGTDTPVEIMAKVKDIGITIFAITDHDAIKGCEEIIAARGESDPQFITGAEFGCRDGEGKYHILGYAYDPGSKAIRDLVDTGHELRMRKVQQRLDVLKNEFGFDFPKEEIEALLRLDNPGKPHIANLMVRYGMAENKEQAFKQYLNGIKVQDKYVDPKTAIEAILAAGGVPVLAHPSYGSGDEIIIGDELYERVRKLKSYGLLGVEAFYSGFTPPLRNEVISIAKAEGLYVTAGSDYHGTNKMVELGDTGMPEDGQLPEETKRFLERCLSK